MIRPFENPDVPSLTKVWRANAERLEFDMPPVDPAMLERALLTRLGFTADDLLVCEDEDGKMMAWCHRSKTTDATIGLVVTDPNCDPSDLKSLIAQSQCDWIGQGMVQASGPTVLPHTGLPPYGFGVGILSSDRLLRQACADAGYQADQSLVEWSMNPTRYRMPMNRATIMFRRSLRLRFVPRLDQDCRQATNRCHLETFFACGDDGRQQGTIHFLSSDPELAVMPPVWGLLEIATDTAVENGAFDDINAFVLSSWIVQAANENVRSISTTILEDSPLADALATVGFNPGQTGAAFRRI